ncbi:MAG: chemotaxis protein CheD [Clostridiales bacterium]|mgnify:CR=1 FL=1|jgi:chemotaxis protein CheD|nr:chemotaxis protein CheD [Clostridiales bacterium]
MIQRVKVGMADLNTVISPGILITLGLGSCVGIALYDGQVKIAGLAHIMLPYSNLIKNNENKAKFADTAILQLVEDMIALGAKKERLRAKLAGGAQMFTFNDRDSNLLKIGERNVIASLETLSKLNIPVVAQDTGGNYGRTVELYADTGDFLIKTIGHGTKYI